MFYFSLAHFDIDLINNWINIAIFRVNIKFSFEINIEIFKFKLNVTFRWENPRIDMLMSFYKVIFESWEVKFDKTSIINFVYLEFKNEVAHVEIKC
jgi:hypothetical protein